MTATHTQPITSNTLETTCLSVTFPVQGTHLPADHGYLLYAAVTHTLPTLHSAPWLGIELISGIPWDNGMIALPAREAHLRLRLPAQNFAAVLPLAGKRLEIAGRDTAGCPPRMSACACGIALCAHCHHQEIHRTRAIS